MEHLPQCCEDTSLAGKLLFCQKAQGNASTRWHCESHAPRGLEEYQARPEAERQEALPAPVHCGAKIDPRP